MIDQQRKRQMLQGIKGYRTNIYPINTIANIIPQLIADLFRTFFIKDEKGNANYIGYDWGRLMEFQINFGNMISNGKFDYLDNIVLQFLNGYGCLIFPFKHTVQFSENEIEKFTKICDGFKNLTWDDIADPFLDALYDLFISAKIKKNKVENW